MHPLLVGRLRLFLYLLAWLMVGVLLAWLLNLMAPRPGEWIALFLAPLVIVYAFISLSAWWVCRSLPLTKVSPVRLVSALLGSTAFSAILWVSIAGAWDRVICGAAENQTGVIHARPQDYALLLAFGAGLYFLSIVVHYLLLAFETSRVAERRAYESEVAAREAQVRALRAQLNPHFLFNSLNSINALVGSNPEAARRMCQGLGDFLRQTLNLGGKESVTLSDELKLIEDYLAIEKVRFGPRLSVERETDPAAEPCLVPPLLLQPLVENAIKHGVADRIEGGLVRIEASVTGDRLRIRVVNPLDPDAPDRRGEGVGIENVRRRLATLESGQARIDVTRTEKDFAVTLELPAVSRDDRPVRPAETVSAAAGSKVMS